MKKYIWVLLESCDWEYDGVFTAGWTKRPAIHELDGLDMGFTEDNFNELLAGKTTLLDSYVYYIEKVETGVKW